VRRLPVQPHRRQRLLLHGLLHVRREQAVVTAEHTRGDGLNQTIFFMDLRSHNKEFERYVENARSNGVRFIRSRPHSILLARITSGCGWLTSLRTAAGQRKILIWRCSP